MRRRRADKREVNPDPKFNQKTISRFINILMIDGKKCWYQGRPGISKDKLSWPAATVGQRARPSADSAPAAVVAPVTRRNPVQTNAPDDAEPDRALTFRERWPH